ncbi:MAG: hypothetical protein HW419_2192 [Deltaproteobacteria bacterium]|nr:hypothetical protein [Deltaproteobacteria bacterium]
MLNSKRSRFILGAISSIFLSAFIVYCVQNGYVHAIGGAKILLSLTGVMFLAISMAGAVMVHRGRIRLAEQNRPVVYVAFFLLGIGGLTGLWAGLPLDRLPTEWSAVGIYFAAINLVLMFIAIPLCAYFVWRRQRR